MAGKKKKKQKLPKASSRATSSKSKTEPDLSSLAFPQHLAENTIIEELRETVQRLKVFDSIGKALTSHLDLSEILRLVIREFGALIGCERLGLILLDPQLNEFYFQFPESIKQKKSSFPIGRGLIGKCIERGRPLLSNDPTHDSQFDPEIDAAIVSPVDSLIILPILSKGLVLGAICFAKAANEGKFSDEDKRIVESFGDYLAIAVENATNYQKVQDLTITDDLTQLYNSRYMPVVLEREIARARRYDEELSMVFIDLDNFKSVNDIHGHLAGSSILTEFGNFLYHQIRTTDVGIRYGGDEFVLILPKTSKAQAVHVIERMIEELRSSVFLKSRHLNIQITASFGVATFPEDANSIDGLIAAADRAMYEVKRQSKDGVFAANWKSK